MALTFRSLGRALKKAAKSKLIQAAARAGAAAATGGASEGVIRGVGLAKKATTVLKGVAGVTRARRRLSKMPPVSVVTMTEKYGNAGAIPPQQIKATTMPGGAPLQGARKAKLRTVSGRALARKYSPLRGRGPQKKRKAPKGGLDLKGLSKSWHAAGKPGSWQAWVSKGGK